MKKIKRLFRRYAIAASRTSYWWPSGTIVR